ncbi:MAG: hypothetical protein JW786_08855 [Desulfobacterales bacterium]|nr:hypothetical protein [Desulfobacterales bacterium]
MSKRVLVPIADGSEDIEAVCIIDVLLYENAGLLVGGKDRRSYVLRV